MGETATITMLFTDVVDSTALYDRLGPAATDDLRRAQFAVMRNALAGNNGTEVKSTGDGLMVAFSSAADAVACAVDMQKALADLRRSDDRFPATRIGVSVGEATAEDNDWYGPPVVEAARLCALADGGQIVVTTLVAMLVGSRGSFEFVDLGERELKGFNKPVAVSEVTWTADTALVPLPYVVAAITTGPFVGRADELERLSRAVENDTLLLIGGEPGIGKTRAVAELAARLHADGSVVLWGRSDEELAVPYQPFVEALRYFIDNAPDDMLAAADPQPDLLRLVPELKERVPGIAVPAMADAEVERLRMFDAVSDLLAAIARTAPVFVVLDDLHWASAPTLMLLRYLTRPGHEPAGVVIAATYRDTELDRTHPLAKALADLRRQPGVERISLGGLDVDAVADYVGASGGDTAVASAVFDETEGNPFFVAEVVRHLAETGDGAGVPEGVREVIGHRLSRLSDAANKVLAVASAVGAEVDLDLLEAVPDAADTGAVLEGLEEAVAARLMREVPRPPGRFVFNHALVRHALYAELSGARRARLHARIGAAMESLGVAHFGAAALAHHYAEGAAAGTVDEAIEWSGRAAEDARDRLAFEEAVTHRDRAVQVFDLKVHGDCHDRLALQAAHVLAVRDAADIDNVRTLAMQLAAHARECGDARMLATGAILRTDWGLAGIVDDEADALLTEAMERVDELGDDALAVRAELVSLRAFYDGIYLGQGLRALPVAEEAVALARASGDVVILGRALGTEMFLLQSSADLERQQRVHDEFVAAARLAQSDTTRGGSADYGFIDLIDTRHRPILALQRGDIAGFDEGLTQMTEVQRQVASFLASAFTAMWTAMRALIDGRLDDAEAASNGILEHTDDINFFNSWAAQMFAINRARGTLPAVRQLFIDAAEQTPGIVALQGLVALAAAECGDVDEARTILSRLLDDPEATFAPNSILPGTLAHLTDVAWAVRSADAARLLLEHLLPYSGQLLVVAWGVTCEGAADRFIGMCLALLDRPDEARSYLERALELERGIDAAPFVARTEAALAALP